MTSTDTLLPCPVPWCGSDVLEVVRSPWSRGYCITCKSCGVQSPSRETEAEATAAWNRRTPPTPATDEREAVARALCELHIRNVRRHDTDATTLEAVLPGAIEMHWFDFQLEADAALSALAPVRAAEILAAEERGYAKAIEDAANEARQLWEYGIPAQEFPRRIRAIEHGEGK